MALIPTPDVYGYTIFCEDIRHEIGGKYSFIGAYTGAMIVHVPFPVTLPAFAMAVALFQRRKVFQPNLSLSVFLPGDPDSEASIQGRFQEGDEGRIAEITALAVDSLHPATHVAEPDDRYVVMNAQMKFSQLILKQPGIIKVRAVIGDDMFRLGGLRVSTPPAT